MEIRIGQREMLPVGIEGKGGKNIRVVRSGRRGASMIESVLILVPLLAIFLALIDFSLFLFAKNTLLHAVREGCRYGVTSQVAGGLGQVDSIKQVVIRNSMGFIGDPSKVSVEFFDPNTMAPLAGAGANRGGNVLRVSIQNFSWAMLAPLMRAAGSLDINVASSDLIEPPAIGGVPTL